MGLLMTNMQEDATSAFLVRAGDVDLELLNSRLNDLEQQVRGRLVEQDVEADAVHCQSSADLRYHGQIYELSVPFEMHPVTAEGLGATFERFEELYEDIYTIRLEGGLPELVSLRVSATAEIPQYRVTERIVSGDLSPRGTRVVLDGGEWLEAPVYERYSLPTEVLIGGPAIVEEPGSTIWVGSGMSGTVDQFGNFVIQTSGADLHDADMHVVSEEV
jgi:N-methylhydantoinase A